MAISLGFACLFVSCPRWRTLLAFISQTRSRVDGADCTLQDKESLITDLTGYLGHTVYFMGFNGLPLA